MKALGVSAQTETQRFVSQQIHYTLQAREAEYELIPATIDQGLGVLVWSPLAGGLLSGKFRRGREAPETSRHLTEWDEPPVRDQEKLYDIVRSRPRSARPTGSRPPRYRWRGCSRGPA